MNTRDHADQTANQCLIVYFDSVLQSMSMLRIYWQEIWLLEEGGHKIGNEGGGEDNVKKAWEIPSGSFLQTEGDWIS